MSSRKPEQPVEREFTKRTVHELRAIYEGRTRLQADAFMADEKGKLIEVEGTVMNVDNGMAFLQVGQGEHNGMVDYVECRFAPSWNAKLGTYRQKEPMKIRGVIGPSQNGAQIYLQDCEIISQIIASPAAPTPPTTPPGSGIVMEGVQGGVMRGNRTWNQTGVGVGAFNSKDIIMEDNQTVGRPSQQENPSEKKQK